MTCLVFLKDEITRLNSNSILQNYWSNSQAVFYEMIQTVLNVIIVISKQEEF